MTEHTDEYLPKPVDMIAVDREGNLRRDVAERLQGLVSERSSREQRHHADQSLAHDQGVSRERDHALASRPRLVADSRVVEDRVGQVGGALGRDQTDLVHADRDAAVRAVEVRVQAGARTQHESVVRAVVDPDPRERRAEPDHRGAAAMKA